MAEPAAVPVSRRERVRADTAREIKETARRVLVAHGVDGLALRAVAREMGMTAPALYRYFASREELVEHVVGDLYEELVADLEAARDAARPATPGVQLMTISRRFRAWALAHHAEFGLLFGSPAERVGTTAQQAKEGPAGAGARRFGETFGALIAVIYLERGFPIPADEDLDPAYQEQLRLWCDTLPVPLPLGVMHVFLSCWLRLYGTVCMEAFGHLRFAVDDAEPVFEAELRSLADLLGLRDDYRPPTGV
jgi:AcrR family transcriptional regulator